MSLKTDNDRRIKAAFARLRRSEQELIPRAFEAFLDEAVKLALQFHDPEHRHHIEKGENYGWLIVHDGQEVKRYVKAEGDGPLGKANAALDQILSEVNQKGWVGVVMAGMHPMNYYQADYEIDILEDVMALTPELFRKHFKKMSL